MVELYSLIENQYLIFDKLKASFKNQDTLRIEVDGHNRFLSLLGSFFFNLSGFHLQGNLSMIFSWHLFIKIIH